MEHQTYKQRLGADQRWAWLEGCAHFDERNAVWKVLRRLTTHLGKLGIAYAVAGALALFKHGYRRFSDNIDIVVTQQGRQTIDVHLEELGLTRLPQGERFLYDIQEGVRVWFIVAGSWPASSTRPPIVFPDPESVGVEIGIIRYVNLRTMLELKLAASLRSADELRHADDVQQTIKTLALPRELADELNPYVRDKYLELWRPKLDERGDEPEAWQNWRA